MGYFKSNIVRFLDREVMNTLSHLEQGLISKEQAVGSLNTLYRIASEIKDSAYMLMICKLNAQIRTVEFFFNLVRAFEQMRQQAAESREEAADPLDSHYRERALS